MSPHWVPDFHTQHLQKLNVWAGLIGRHIIGPFFFEDNLNAEKYLSMLRLQIIPSIIEKFPRVNEDEILYQHDGTPVHYVIHVRKYLDEILNKRWIG